MANASNQRTVVIVQIIVLAIVCIGLAVLAIVFGVFAPSKEYRSLTMRVESTSGTIRMTYTVPGDEVKTAITVSTPWEKTWSVKVGSEVYLLVGNPNQTGEIKCSLLLEGKVWKKESAKIPTDKVTCAGIVP